MRLYKCYGICEKKHPISFMKKISNKNYCENCHDFILKEREDRSNLYNYICELFDIDKITGLILKQIKQYKEEFNYTYGGMHYSLWYIKEIKGLKFELKYGIARVQYYYEEAKNYFEQQEKISKSSDDIDEIKVKEVKLNYTNLRNVNRSNFTLDIDNLIGGD